MKRERRASVATLVGVFVAGVAACAGAVFAYTSITDDDDPVGPTASSTTTAAAAERLFVLPDVPFTFEYPSEFAAVPADQLPMGYQAILGVSPVNFVDVRLTAVTELSDEEIEGLATSLASDTSSVVDRSSRTVDDVMINTFVVEDTSGETPTLSRLNFLRADGRTWELGCQSDADGRTLIDAACELMLSTFRST